MNNHSLKTVNYLKIAYLNTGIAKIHSVFQRDNFIFIVLKDILSLSHGDFYQFALKYNSKSEASIDLPEIKQFFNLKSNFQQSLSKIFNNIKNQGNKDD